MGSTYVIAGGYTAGHLTPGLAVAEALRERRPDLEVIFAGSTNPADAEFVCRAGLSFLGLPSVPWAGRSAVTRGRSLVSALPAAFIARRRFRAAGAVGLLSLGSYAAVAPAVAARSLGLPVTVFEPNSRLGLANRLIRPFSGQMLVSWLFDPGAVPRSLSRQVVGVPLRAALRDLTQRQPQPPTGEIHLLVLGGSLGDPFLNAQAPGLAGRLATRGLGLRVTHQCGRGLDPAPVRAAYGRAGVRAAVEPFLDPIAPTLGSAHFILTAAGAVTLHEIAAAGIPLLIVPLASAAAAHQLENAEAFARATGCLHRTEATWEEAEAAVAIAAVLGGSESWMRQSNLLRDFVAGDARAEAVGRILGTLPHSFRPA